MSAQGIIHFTGIAPTVVAGGTFTLTHGIQPSVAQILMAPQTKPPPVNGTLTLAYGGVRITFPRSRLAQISLNIGTDGKELWTATVYDRRWMWQLPMGKISGRYNVRRAGNAGIVPGTQRTPQQLAKLCLDALGETGYNLSKLPNNARPEVDWDYERPADALASLCDSLGCRIVLGLNDRVVIHEVGQGAPLPAGGTVTTAAITADPPEVPDELVVVTARARFQGNFPLEAISLEPNGNLVPINQASYRVAGDPKWERVDIPSFNHPNVAIGARRFAQESIYRWYRIKPPLSLPGIAAPVKTLDRILPMDTTQVETQLVNDGQGNVRVEPKPAWVYGIYDLNTPGLGQSGTAISDDLIANPGLKYHRGFAIDAETGVVKFSEPVYQLVKDPAGTIGDKILQPANLRLRVGVALRDAATGAWLRREKSRKIRGANSGTKPAYIIRDDIEPVAWFDPLNAALNNFPATDQEADYYLAAELAKYQLQQPGTLGYAGFLAIPPDGAIMQVTWSIDQRGAAATTASRNDEASVIVPSYEEQRFLQNVHRANAAAKKLPKQQAAAAKKGGG